MNEHTDSEHTASTSASVDAPAPDETTGNRLTDYALDPTVLEALERMEIAVPTPIQQKVLGPVIEGRDVIGKAETGTGKTIGFGAPLVGKIDTNRVAVQALVLTPTRELAQQVSTVLGALGEGRGVKVAMVVGGVHASEQILRLREGSQVVVGTPGRILDLLKDRSLSLVWCETVVIDEADRLFDMGFIDDVGSILDHTPKERQTLLFSATIPPEVKRLMTKYMRDPELYSTSKGLSTVSEIRQVYREVQFPDKLAELLSIIDEHKDETVIVFTNTRHQAIDLDRNLFGHNYPARALHGEHEQELRFKILEAFRNRDIHVLVATDVASRGLDIDDVAVVVNYEVPVDVESYVHRIGRTGRASKEGLAVTLVAPKETGNWRRIMESTRFDIEREGPRATRSASRGGGRGGRSEDRDRRRGRRGSERGPDRGAQRAEGGAEGASSGRRRQRRRRRGRGSGEAAEPVESGAASGAKQGSSEEAAPQQGGGGESRESGSRRDADSSRRQRRQRAGGQRGKSGSSSGSGKDDTLFSNPLKTASSPRAGPVSSDVDLFSMSMKDFLDDTVEIDDFTAPGEHDQPPTPVADDDAAERDEPKRGDESKRGGESRQRRGRRRRARRGQGGSGSGSGSTSSSSGESRSTSSSASSSASSSTSASESASKSSTSSSSSAPASESSGEPRKRRRRRRRRSRSQGGESV